MLSKDLRQRKKAARRSGPPSFCSSLRLELEAQAKTDLTFVEGTQNPQEVGVRNVRRSEASGQAAVGEVVSFPAEIHREPFSKLDVF